MFAYTCQYRLAGNIYETQFYIGEAQMADAVVKATALQAALSELQTGDVEYLAQTVTRLSSPYETQTIIPAYPNGQGVGTTAPSITFLLFSFYSVDAVGKTTHRIRGFVNNDTTDLGKFSVYSTGAGDIDGTSGVATADAAYAGFELAVVTNSVNRLGQHLAASRVVSIGSKRATRRL